MDANRLRVFVEIARAGSVTAAARRLSFTPPAVSQQLAKLEQEAGCVLVERGRGVFRLTSAGQVLLERAERVLGELRDARSAVREEAGAATRRLAMGAFASAAKTLVPAALATFTAAHPQVRLALQDIEPPQGYDLVTSADLDLLITHRYPGTPLPAASGLRREPLLVDPLLVVLPEDHPAADTNQVSLADLAEDEWICGAPGVFNRVTLEDAADAAGVRLSVAFETADYEVTLALVRAGLGVSLIPETVLRESPSVGWVARPLEGPGLEREIYAVRRPRPPQQVLEMVAILRRSARRAELTARTS
ncbi:LysR family transcriptional regulator [Spiractinospora alimapuensis]|uniref:LysR family transcriptional regulator n=1 Tax=Spiractinospora alimapuensis TaxID=2820884 RepID=UPI001F20011B|nr:LysR family transcriptional regulator [Spiractinospora alimapuensis]QVQ52898.1 LysR family transcriptional regulator [Spiractinospora alimapuensis]